jgi:hypothetical protein
MHLTANMEPKNEFATAARIMIFSDGASAEQDEDEDAVAIDDSCDADEEMVTRGRNIAQLRIQKRNSEAGMLKKVIPFHWAPMLSPLTENDIDTCMTLETAALSDPTHRASRDKVSFDSLPFLSTRLPSCGFRIPLKRLTDPSP